MEEETKVQLVVKLLVGWVVIVLIFKLCGSSTNAAMIITGLVLGSVLTQCIKCEGSLQVIQHILFLGLFISLPHLWGGEWVWENNNQDFGLALTVSLGLEAIFLLVYPGAKLV